MELVRLMRGEAEKTFRLIVLTTIIAGALNSFLVSLINLGAESVSSQTISTNNFLLFIFSLAAFLLAKSISETHGQELIETAMSKLRIRMYDTIRKSKLVQIEKINQSDLIGKTSKSIDQVLQCSDSVMYGFQASAMVVFCLFYLYTISTPAFVVIAIGIFVLGYITHTREKLNNEQLHMLIEREGKQSALFADMIQGFKRVKINRRASAEMFDDFTEVVHTTSDLGVAVGKKYISSILLNQAAFYAIIAIVVFVLPQYIHTFTEEVMEITAIVLFIIGYLTGVVQVIPVYGKTNAALANLRELDELLSKSIEKDVLVKRTESFEEFQLIQADKIQFTYYNDEKEPVFSIGPIDFELKRGEMVFITGGNGSGKSTFMKLLTGLYEPQFGAIKIDGQTLSSSQTFEMRELYSTIFPDFHLFQKLYGIPNVDQKRLKELLREMALEDKVQISERNFSTTALSTGQRKRLALVIALLEDRPIYMFDEWAAEQDAHFRKYFYEHILVDLKKRGKTIIAVTHDEHFWNIADRVFTLEQGNTHSRH